MLSLLRESRATLFCFAFCSFFMIGPAYGDFTTILNIPPDPNIGDNQSIGSHTQLNLHDFGVIGNFFDAGDPNGTSTHVEVNISGGSVGGLFNALDGSVVNISGGSVFVGFEAFSGSVVNISGGSVFVGFQAYSGSVVNISGGTVDSGFAAFDGSIVNISGGLVGDDFDAFPFSEVNISGGSVGDAFVAFPFSEVNISGGSVGDDFDALNVSEVNLFGIQFELDALDITASLTLGVPSMIPDRDVTLEGLLADGSPFSFDLNSTNVFGDGEDYFDPLALLTVTLVGPGDFDGNLAVDGADFLKWQRDPSVGLLADWEANYGQTFPPLSASSAAVPEPTTCTLALAALCLAMSRRHSH